jgi:hypothetical protein
MSGNEDWDGVLDAFRALRSRVRTELGGPGPRPEHRAGPDRRPA